MPDQLKAFRAGGRAYLITANEGEAPSSARASRWSITVVFVSWTATGESEN